MKIPTIEEIRWVLSPGWVEVVLPGSTILRMATFGEGVFAIVDDKGTITDVYIAGQKRSGSADHRLLAVAADFRKTGFLVEDWEVMPERVRARQPRGEDAFSASIPWRKSRRRVIQGRAYYADIEGRRS